MARPMTPAEQARFRAAFPNLNVKLAVVTDDSANIVNYNCIAWTVGITSRRLWPGPTIIDFDAFYRGYGYTRSSSGPIAAWGSSRASMTHACISGEGYGPRWESKCGTDLRIQHGLNELVGSTYGRVVAFYDEERGMNAEFRDKLEAVKREVLARSYLTESQRQALEAQTQGISAALRKRFDAAFAAWKQSWSRGGLAFSSNPRDRAVGKEFDRLIALGPAIIPLVVEKLADPENSFALQLYDTIQLDPNLVIHFPADDPRILEGEQGRARRVVQVWLAR